MHTTGNLRRCTALIMMCQTLLALPTLKDRSAGYVSAVLHENLSGETVAAKCTAIFRQRDRFESQFIHFRLINCC